MRKKVLVSLLVCLFSGCAVGPDYEVPQIPVAAQYMGVDQHSSTVEAVNMYWWKGFTDPVLDDLILSAVKENLTLQASVARVNQARAVQQQSLLNLFPVVTADASYTKQRFGNQGAFGGLGGASGGGNSRGFDVGVYEVGFDASWELDVFGRVRRGLEQSIGESDAAIADLEDSIRVLVSEVARNYFDLKGAQLQAKVARENAKNQEQVVNVAEALYKGGQTTEFDVMRAKALLFSTLATVSPLEADARIAMYRIAVLLGKQPHELVSKLETTTALPSYSGSISLGDPTSLIQRRPDVRAAERRLAAATAGIGVAKGDYFPKISFVGNVSLQSRSWPGLRESPGASWAFGPSITWAAFNMGRVIAQVDGAEAATKEAMALYQQAVLTALEDVEGALARFSAVRERRDLLKLSAEQSEKAVQIARTQYENGLIDLLPVLDAQKAAFSSQEQLAFSNTSLLTSLVSLYKALSGGWDGAIAVPVGDDVPELLPVGQSVAAPTSMDAGATS
jgi:multidrug efflux system outer membrane protein